MRSSRWVAISGALFLLLSALFVFGMLVANRVTLSMVLFLVAFAVPQGAVGVAILAAMNRARALIAGAVAGIPLTGYWTYIALDELQSGSEALGVAVVFYPLVAAAATATAVVSLYLWRREGMRSAPTPEPGTLT
jgi:hypothetical protein